MTTLFLTGSTGFIGRSILEEIGTSFNKVVLPIRTAPSAEAGDNCEFITVDGSAKSLCDALQHSGADHVINAAAYGVSPQHRNPADMQAVNIELPIKLAEMLKTIGGKSFIQLGSMSEYDALPERAPINEKHQTSPRASEYGGSKAEASKRLMELPQDNADLNIIVLRLFGVFGPKETAHRLLPSLYAGLSASENVPMSHGKQIRDFIYIKDVISAISASLNLSNSSQGAREIVNIGSGLPLSVREFAIEFCRASGFDEALLKFGQLPQRDTDVAYIQGNITKAKALLDWSPKWDIKAAFEDYLKQRSLSINT